MFLEKAERTVKPTDQGVTDVQKSCIQFSTEAYSFF